VLLLTALLLGGITVANIALHGRSAAHERAAARLNELNMLLHAESSLQWKSLAKGNTPVAVARELGVIRSREKGILAELPTAPELRDKVSAYHQVLDTELGLLGVGRTVEALALEQASTDPAFVALAADLDRLGRSEASAADLAKNLAGLILGLAMAATVPVIGFLLYRFEREHRISERATGELLEQQRIAFDALTENEALVRHQAGHDPLTGLPNRRALAELLAKGGEQALLVVDLDDFKPVNDRLGHAAGDELLITVARRLHMAVREADTVVRLGGDEFAVVVHDGNRTAAIGVAERIIEALAEPFSIAGAVVTIGASVGISAVTEDADRLMREADQAMYRVKQSSKGGYRVYSDPSAPATLAQG